MSRCPHSCCCTPLPRCHNYLLPHCCHPHRHTCHCHLGDGKGGFERDHGKEKGGWEGDEREEGGWEGDEREEGGWESDEREEGDWRVMGGKRGLGGDGEEVGSVKFGGGGLGRK